MEIEEELTKVNASFLCEEDRQKYVDEKTYEYVYQNLQSFVFNLNVPSRWGTQTPFTNITMDWVCPEDLREKRLDLGGTPFKYKFGELQKEMDIVNRAFIEVMTAGDSKGRTFTFPIPTYNIGNDFNWDDPQTLELFEMTAKYGTPYFQNFINSDLNPSDVRSMCCRLQLDKRELRKKGGGLFGADEFTGSIGVITINLPRIGYLSKTKEGIIKEEKTLSTKFFPTVFDSISIATLFALRKNSNIDVKELEKRRLDLLSDEKFIGYSTIRTTNIQNIRGRISLALKYLYGM